MSALEGFVLTTCQTCQGFGMLSQPQGTITCQTCGGEAAWLQNTQGQKLLFSLPELLLAASAKDVSYKKWIKYGAAGLSFSVLVASGLIMLTQDGVSPSRLLWSKEPLHALFGLSGLASIWGLLAIQKHQTSDHSLHELTSDLAADKSTNPLHLNQYANPRVPELINRSMAIAKQLHTATIDETILLCALLEQPRIVVMLARLELSAAQLAEEIKGLIPKSEAGDVRSFIISPLVRQRLYAAVGQAIEHDFPYIDLEDILLAYAKDPGDYADLFKDYGLDYEAIYAVSRWYAEDQERSRQWAFWLERGRTRPKGYMNRAWTALPTPFLDQYSLDITRQAANGGVAMVTVRDAELSFILQILGRTQKNSVLLVGEPGVGKDSILGALALRMIEEKVPEILKDKRLVSVDLGPLLTDAGSAESNLQRALDEITQAGNVILAVPDIHTLVGTSGNALDAATIMAGALSRGTVQLVSTATYADYHRYVESSAQLSSLLDIVEIKEVTSDQAIQILEQEAPHLEDRQHVYLTYPAIQAAVRLAQRYLPEQVLPGSAVNLLDEAASLVAQEGRKWVLKHDLEVVVEQKTHTPVQNAGEAEASMLLNLEDTLHKRIIGQEDAVQAIASALRRARAGLHVDKRPISSFLFVGPTGVGKTETAKAVADVFFGSENSMIRLDMSEYQDGQSVYKLIGSPAATSDSRTEGGALTTPIREHPFSLILLDEIEKAYPDVLNLFLQLLDDGRLTENTGRTVHYNNSIIVATSNAGSAELIELMRQGITPSDLSKQVLSILQKHFRPEFLNRFDAIIPFHPLRPEEINQITSLMLTQVTQRARDQKYEISFSEEAVEKIGQLGFDPLYGARPLRRLIQDKVEGLLARKILEKSLLPGQALRIEADMIS